MTAAAIISTQDEDQPNQPAVYPFIPVAIAKGGQQAHQNEHADDNRESKERS